jgi:Ca2+-binding RTX toxin-like protein
MFTRATGRTSALATAGSFALCAAALWGAGTADASSSAECFGHTATITSNAKKIVGTSHDDVIVAGHGSQRIDGGDGDDLICADGGNDRVDGGAGRDRIDGDEGDDRLSGGRSADLITGNRGDDLIVGDSNPSDSYDVLNGGSGDDLIRGGDGADLLKDGPGSDVLRGDAGDDELRPQDDQTADRYSGGGETDVIDYAADEDSWFDNGVTVSLDGVANDGVNCPQQCEGDNAGADIENIVGSYGDDTLIGNDGVNVIDDPDAQGGNTIQALGGADIVHGGYGDDTIDGGTGDDALHGSGGDDTIDGAGDNDQCFGDTGTDVAANCESEVGFP